MQSIANITTQVGPDKFAFRAFKRLAYDREISGPLVVSYLLGLPDHYILSNNVKSINLALLRKRFPESALHTYEAMADVDDLVRLRCQTSAPSTTFDHYWGRGSKLQNFCLFIYMRVINIYPRKLAISSDIEFVSSHPNSLTHVQRHFTKPRSQAEVKILGPLFDNDGIGEIIPVDRPETPEGLNDIAVILLTLFVPWDCLQPLFSEIGARNDNYLSFGWTIWCFFYPTLDDHVKYYATNILQMRKSRIDARELAASNDYAVSQEENVMEEDIIINSDDIEIDDINEQCYDMELDTDASIENLVTLTVYNWRSTDATDSLAFPATSHMWNSLRHADENGKSSAIHCHLI